jgi:hypothetical protein
MKFTWLPEGERQIGHGEQQRRVGKPGDVVDITAESAAFHLRKVVGRLRDPKDPGKGRAPCLVPVEAEKPEAKPEKRKPEPKPEA